MSKEDWIKKYVEAIKGFTASVPIEDEATGIGASAYESVFPSLLPIAVRMASKLVVNEIVAVAPMSSPSGKLFYRDYIYGNNYRWDSSKLFGEVLKRIKNRMSEFEKGIKKLTGSSIGPVMTKIIGPDYKTFPIKEFPSFFNKLAGIELIKPSGLMSESCEIVADYFNMSENEFRNKYKAKDLGIL